MHLFAHFISWRTSLHRFAHFISWCTSLVLHGFLLCFLIEELGILLFLGSISSSLSSVLRKRYILWLFTSSVLHLNLWLFTSSVFNLTHWCIFPAHSTGHWCRWGLRCVAHCFFCFARRFHWWDRGLTWRLECWNSCLVRRLVNWIRFLAGFSTLIFNLLLVLHDHSSSIFTRDLIWSCRWHIILTFLFGACWICSNIWSWESLSDSVTDASTAILVC